MKPQQKKLARMEANLAIEEFVASARMLERELGKAVRAVMDKADLANHDDEMPIEALPEVCRLMGTRLYSRVHHAAGRCIGLAAMYEVFSND